MRLEDRVAFACMYLSDARLHEYIQASADAAVQRGDLAGILLTGMTALQINMTYISSSNARNTSLVQLTMGLDRSV